MQEFKASTSIHGFLHWEKTRPDTVFMTQPDAAGQTTDYTWREVGEQARRMASHLVSLGLPERSNIAILGKNTAHWIIADLAIWMAGHVSVPLYSTMNAETVRYVLDHAQVPLMFVGRLDNWADLESGVAPAIRKIALPMFAADGVAAWDEVIAAQAPLQNVFLPKPAELATIIYTSGTTGAPKGVMHSFGSIAAYALMAGEYCGLSPDDRLLSYLPLAHTAERSFVESNALFFGCHVFFNYGLETFSQDLLRARPTLFASMPRLWTKFYQGVCAKLPKEQQALLNESTEMSAQLKKKVLAMLGLDAVRMAFTGSAPLPLEIVSWYRNLGLELLDVYGMTEDFCYSHYSRPGLVRLGYVGHALPGVQSRISAQGELEVRSPGQMMGYYRQPELTAESMTADGYFRTGDRGEFDDAGRLKITGRVKELLKTSKGKYVAPAPIENKFAHHRVESVCVTGPGSPQPFALILLTQDARSQLADEGTRTAVISDLEGLLQSVNEQLERHEKLAFAVIVKEPWSADNGFLTATMKLRRSVIESHYLKNAQKWADLNQPLVFEAD